MKLVWHLARQSWKSLLTAGLLGGVSGVTNVALLAIVHRALQQPATSSSKLLVLFVICCLASLVTRIASQLFLTWMTQHSISRLRLDLCQRILGSPLRHLEEIGSHRMLGALTGDVLVVAQAFTGIPMLCVNAVILISGAIYLGILSHTLLIGALLFAVLGGWSYWFVSRFASPYLRQGRELQDVLMRHVRSLIQGVKEMKLHRDRRHEFIEGVVTPLEEEYRQTQFVGTCIQDAAITWGRLLFLVAIGALLFAWPKIQTVDAATLTGYTLAIFYLMSPLERIIGWIPLMVRAGISVDKIERLGVMLDQESAEASSSRRIEAWEQISLVGVTHVYYREGHQSGFLLGPIDLTLSPGEILFIVGGNGSGKTTLAKLLTGLYTPDNGEIRVDGLPIDDEHRESYRQLFAVVFDDGVLFERLWGLGGPDLDEQASRYLRRLGLDHVVEVKDGEFSTTHLSRGQRKRLALLTAYLEDRSVYLFDEWAADQDPVFKQTFYHEILPDLKRRGKTVVAITHDDRYFSTADRVVKLEEGRIADVEDPESRRELLVDTK
jgi:cyclic peptide transporter